ncbi:adhesion G-protein coupled receptor G2-like, partial [Achroia grisella]|uniref:adhesion G-protein coupled receptor G2-like n=1 Tax=Achroia grisella TaxID=688607 RepID=UPI0027D21A61
TTPTVTTTTTDETTTTEVTTTTETTTDETTTTETETTTDETTTTEVTTTTEESTTTEPVTTTETTTDETTTTEVTTTTEESTTTETTTPTVTTTETTTDETTTTEVTTTTEESTTTETTTPTPDDIIDQIIEDILDILENEDVPVYVDTITDAFDQVNDLLDMEEDVTFPPEMLDILDTLGSRIDLNGALNDTIVRDNLALLMADASPDNPVRGLRLTAGGEGRTRNSFSKDTFEFLSDDDPDHLNADASDAVVHLPESVATSTRRISFVVFRDDQAFANTNSRLAVNSRVISVNVENLTQFDNDELVDIYLSPLQLPEQDRRRSCGYWEYQEDSTGYWSQEGCTFIPSDNPTVLDTCRCDRLGRFAQIVISQPTFSKSNENALQAITLTGSSLSIIGAIFIVITALLFRSWRSTFRNQVWVQLSIALFILSVCFIVTASVRYVEYSVSCLLTGIFMHYSVLASFCWILVVAVIAYRDLVIISRHENTRKMIVASSFSWGVPIILMMIYALAAEEPYAMRFAEMSPSGSFCYPSGLGLWLSVYTPIGVILLANVILFFYIVGYISRSVYILNEENAKKAIKSSRIGFGLVILFSLAWVFGIFAYNIVTAYLFTITVTIQCFILFIFVVCGDKDTRDLWLHKLKLKSSTNNSLYSRRLSPSF